VLAALAVTSISVTAAHSQATTPAKPAAPDADDEDAAAGPAGKPLVAPAEPKARVAWLRDHVAAAVATGAKAAHARITVSVVDLATGNELVNQDADRAMSLASNAKLLTSVSALASLGGGSVASSK
jgi:D-alanyl-D-alanine carboxypeptidase/D-alanyl-D-alanine-endopeptidase (penicillin-binding protein 4)